MTTTVRVVQSGFPLGIHVAIHYGRSPAIEPEILSDAVPTMQAGMELAEKALRERGQRVGAWEPIGPCVREAPILEGSA